MESPVGVISPMLNKFGKFQKIILMMFIFMYIPSGCQVLLMYFCTITPTWKCIANNTECIWNGTLSADDNRRCNISRSSWYYTERKSYSLVTEFDIHCEDQWQLQLISALFFVGWSIGSVVIGWLGDRFGRKFVLFPSMVSMIVVTFISAFQRNIYLVMVTRLVSGFFFPGTEMQMFILISEYVGVKKRPCVASILFMANPISFSLLALKAYFIRDWRILSVLCTLPYLIFVIAFYKFIPESVKWLAEHGRTDEGEKIIDRIVYWNRNCQCDQEINISANKTVIDKTNPLDLFRARSMAMKSLIQAILWITISIVYYGLHLASNDLGGSVYRDFTILCLVETIGYPISAISCNKYGRKKSVLMPLTFGSILCLVIAFIPAIKVYNTARIVTGIVANVSITLSYSSVFIWSAELYPVKIRCQGMGFLMLVSHVATIACPWLTKGLKAFGAWCPFVAFSVPSLIASATGLWLPETKDDNTQNGLTKIKRKDYDAGAVIVNGNVK